MCSNKRCHRAKGTVKVSQNCKLSNERSLYIIPGNSSSNMAKNKCLNGLMYEANIQFMNVQRKKFWFVIKNSNKIE